MSDSARRLDRHKRSSGRRQSPDELSLAPGELETTLALAEGRALDPEQRAIADRLQRDPVRRQALERQRLLVAALHAGGPVVPPALRAPTARSGARRRRPLSALPVAVVGTAVVIAAALVMLVGGSRDSRPTAAQVAALWRRPASGPVAANPAHPDQLDVSFHGIAYPNYRDREGWHPLAARRDRIDGLLTTTVLYATGARRAAYTVVPVSGLAVPATASHLHVAGLSLTEFRAGKHWVVTFEKQGSTCVLTAAAPRERLWLIRLATWHGGAVTNA